MRQVAVTEGDKVSAQMQLGYSVNSYGVGDLVAVMNALPDSEVDQLVQAYLDEYDVVAALRPGGAQHASLIEGARIEAGLRQFLGRPAAWQGLHHHLRRSARPGAAARPGPQRLMADGYGFAGEGDWKTAALVRPMKVIGRERYRHLVYGGLHLSPEPRRHAGARRAYAGDLPLDRRAEAQAGDPPAGHRRQGRPGAAGVRLKDRPGAKRLAGGHGQPLPPDRQPGRRCASRRAAAQAAGGQGAVGAAARPERSGPPRGFWPAARTTPASACRSASSSSKTTPRWPASSSC